MKNKHTANPKRSGRWLQRGVRHTAKTGAELIAAERTRQIKREKFTAEHDDQHTSSELLQAAICYAENGSDFCLGADGVTWPWAATDWKPTGKIENLVKAGALIAAEIDRLQRAASVPNDRADLPPR